VAKYLLIKMEAAKFVCRIINKGGKYAQPLSVSDSA
jgi:hypothetical protein